MADDILVKVDRLQWGLSEARALLDPDLASFVASIPEHKNWVDAVKSYCVKLRILASRQRPLARRNSLQRPGRSLASK